MTDPAQPEAGPVRGVAYPSFYFADLDEAVALYGRLFGEVAYREEGLAGLRLGDTWLTLFGPGQAPERGANPRNAEVALRLASREDVDALHARFVSAGARTVMPPQDTWMYESMRYACVDDPLGVRWDLFCPLPGSAPADAPPTP